MILSLQQLRSSSNILPRTVVGQGAHLFATEHGIASVDPASLVSPEAHKEWTKWKARLEASVVSDDTRPSESGPTHEDNNTTHTDGSKLEETVGAVASDSSGVLAAGVSSGGLLLKYPGRIGEVSHNLELICH